MESDIVESHVGIDGDAVVDDFEQSRPILVVGRTGVRPVEVRLLPIRRFAVLVHLNEGGGIPWRPRRCRRSARPC